MLGIVTLFVVVVGKLDWQIFLLEQSAPIVIAIFKL